MDRYFYSIESIDGIKIVHFFGNVYSNDSGESEEGNDYRIAEWTWMYIEIDKLTNMLNNSTLWDYLNENVAYMGNLSEEQADKICEEYFGGTSGINLDIEEVTHGTACGDYWFDR